MTSSRAEFLRISLALLVTGWSGWPRIASAGGVPIALQAQLLGRLASFDRNFAARAGAIAKVALHHRARDPESESITNAIAKATAGLGEVGGLRPEVSVAELVDPATLAQRCAAERLALLYFGPSTESDMPAVARALAGVDVLSVGGSGAHADHGSVVGFDVEEGRPRLVINLRSARAQNVAFRADVLKLARVIE
jgi:hypothetical protein